MQTVYVVLQRVKRTADAVADEAHLFGADHMAGSLNDSGPMGTARTTVTASKSTS